MPETAQKSIWQTMRKGFDSGCWYKISSMSPSCAKKVKTSK